MLPNVVGLLSNCTCLRQLDLTKCAKLKDENLIDAIRGSSTSSNQPARYNALGTLGTGIGATIRKLCLRECREITDQSLLCIAANCYKLRSVDLYNCQGISDEVRTNSSRQALTNFAGKGVKTLLKATGKTLQLLDLSKTSIDKSVVIIAKRCLSLRSLKLEGCKSVSESSLCKLGSKKMPHVMLRYRRVLVFLYDSFL